MFGNLGSNAKV